MGAQARSLRGVICRVQLMGDMISGHQARSARYQCKPSNGGGSYIATPKLRVSIRTGWVADGGSIPASGGRSLPPMLQQAGIAAGAHVPYDAPDPPGL